MPDPPIILELLTAFLAWVLGELVPLGALFALIAYVLSLPLRRDERARVVLDLLEHGFKTGQSPERSLAAAAAAGDHSLGVAFDRAGALMRAGAPAEQALQQVPRLLPPQVLAMLKVGRETGDWARLLPACRTLLKDSVSRTRSALNYLPILALLLLPAQVFLLFSLRVWVWPRLVEVAADMGLTLPAFCLFVLRNGVWFAALLLLVVLFFWAALFFFVGGPGFLSRLCPPLRSLQDRAAYCLPWRRRRFQRDFTAVLALLLDAGVHEAKAVELAAESTANRLFMGKAARALHELRAGARLNEALRQLDDAGEFHWRLSNATHRASAFREALAGWHEALDAKSFQQEQAATQILTTTFVLLNGVVIGMIVTSVFLFLRSIMEKGLLW